MLPVSHDLNLFLALYPALLEKYKTESSYSSVLMWRE